VEAGDECHFLAFSLIGNVCRDLLPYPDSTNHYTFFQPPHNFLKSPHPLPPPRSSPPNPPNLCFKFCVQSDALCSS
jgi:hypothetical protein